MIRFRKPMQGQVEFQQRGGRGMIAVLCLCAAVSAVCLLLPGRFIQLGLSDDALIAARYASNLQSHGELSYNLGDRVEGYTSFLTVILVAVLQSIGIAADRGVYFLSLFSGIAGCALVSGIVYRMDGRIGIALAAGLLPALLLPWTVWAHSGMETCLFAVLWVLTLWLYSESSPRLWRLSGLMLAFTAMTRPEGLLLFLPIALYHLRLDPKKERLRLMLPVFVIIFGAYFLWRWSYFGYLLPNTYYAKVDRFNAALLVRGSKYLAGLVVRMLPILLAGFAFSRALTIDPRARLIGYSVLTYAVFGIVLVGGDHFAAYRFGVHILLAIVILCLLSFTGKRGKLIWVPLLGCVLTSFAFFNDIKDYSEQVSDVKKWTYIGGFLKATTEPRASIATLAIGAIGYYSERKIVDMYGIVDRHIAHLKMDTGKGLAGHEKFDNAYVLDQRPDIILLDNQLHAKPGTVFLWGVAAPDLEKRPQFKENYRFIPVQTGKGWIHLFVRKDHLGK